MNAKRIILSIVLITIIILTIGYYYLFISLPFNPMMYTVDNPNLVQFDGQIDVSPIENKSDINSNYTEIFGSQYSYIAEYEDGTYLHHQNHNKSKILVNSHPDPRITIIDYSDGIKNASINSVDTPKSNMTVLPKFDDYITFTGSISYLRDINREHLYLSNNQISDHSYDLTFRPVRTTTYNNRDVIVYDIIEKPTLGGSPIITILDNFVSDYKIYIDKETGLAVKGEYSDYEYKIKSTNYNSRVYDSKKYIPYDNGYRTNIDIRYNNSTNGLVIYDYHSNPVLNDETKVQIKFNNKTKNIQDVFNRNNHKFGQTHLYINNNDIHSEHNISSSSDINLKESDIKIYTGDHIYLNETVDNSLSIREGYPIESTIYNKNEYILLSFADPILRSEIKLANTKGSHYELQKNTSNNEKYKDYRYNYRINKSNISYPLTVTIDELQDSNLRYKRNPEYYQRYGNDSLEINYTDNSMQINKTIAKFRITENKTEKIYEDNSFDIVNQTVDNSEFNTPLDFYE